MGLIMPTEAEIGRFARLESARWLLSHLAYNTMDENIAAAGMPLAFGYHEDSAAFSNPLTGREERTDELSTVLTAYTAGAGSLEEAKAGIDLVTAFDKALRVRLAAVPEARREFQASGDRFDVIYRVPVYNASMFLLSSALLAGFRDSAGLIRSRMDPGDYAALEDRMEALLRESSTISDHMHRAMQSEQFDASFLYKK